MAIDVSIIIPFLDERPTLRPLVERITAVLTEIGCSHEIILINDGSQDDGDAEARALAGEYNSVVFIDFVANYGKAAALSAGIRHASGATVITMDADLQDDPKEIPRMLAKLDEGFDVVSGWKQKRHDPLGKRLPSLLFNAVVNRVFGLRLHDHNCGFKAYRRQAADRLELYGELHRFTPALLHSWGFSVTEVVVEHHPRTHGYSKYGAGRLIKGFLDLLTVLLITRFRWRPLHFFGTTGLLMGIAGFGILVYLTILWFAGLGPIGNRPLLFLGMLLVIVGTQFVGTGLLAELQRARTIRETDKYLIREVVGGGPAPKNHPDPDAETSSHR